MIGILFLLLLALPIIELAVIIEVGSQIGIIPTLVLLIGISVVGAWLLKREGTAAWRRLQEALARGDVPTKEVTDGAMILFGGALLITPGFVSDALGLLMVFPVTRAALKNVVRRLLGFLALRRFGVAGEVGRRVYDARVTRVRRTSGTTTTPTTPSTPREEKSPDRLPSSTRGLDEGGSPDS